MVRSVQIKPVMVSVLVLAGIAAAVAFAAQAAVETDGKVYWSDGDSGRLPDGTKFRLHDVDAPETGSLKQRGGADCEAERVLGYEAKAAVLALMDGKAVAVTHEYGLDRYGRMVVDLSIDGQDLAKALIAGGTHRPWDYDGGEPKPDWCTPVRKQSDGKSLMP